MAYFCFVHVNSMSLALSDSFSKSLALALYLKSLLTSLARTLVIIVLGVCGIPKYSIKISETEPCHTKLFLEFQKSRS